MTMTTMMKMMIMTMMMMITKLIINDDDDDDDDGTKDNVKFRDGGRVEREALKVEAEIV